MNITATSENSAQQIDIWKTESGSYWAAVRLVGWISQDLSNKATTLYFKWQVGADNYWPYWYTSHTYSVTFGGVTKSVSFQLPQATNNWVNLSGTQSITVGHTSSDNTNYTYTGTLSLSGYKYWEAVNNDVSITFPTITVSSESEDDEEEETDTDDEESIEPTSDTRDSKFYILCDDSVLYSSNDFDYAVINPRLQLPLNQADSLDFTIPPTNVMYSKIDKLRSTIEVRQGSDVLFRGRVLDDDIDFYNQKSIHCEGAFTFLSDTVFPPYSEGTYTNVKALFKAAIESHYSQIPESTPKRRLKYVKCNVTDSIDGYSDDYQYTADVVSSLLNNFGGYLKVEYFEDGTTGISYLASSDHTSSQTIDFGQNLIDIQQTVDASNIYTAVIIQGEADSDTGIRPSITAEDSDAIEKYGRITRYFTIDDVTSTDELTTYAYLYLTVGANPTTSVEIKAIDLHLVNSEIEKIHKGDFVRIRSLPHGIDGYFQCSNIDIDLENPENTVYTFGSISEGLTDSYLGGGGGSNVIYAGGSGGGSGSGGEGTYDYNELYESSLPKINSVMLKGNKRGGDLGLIDENEQIIESYIDNLVINELIQVLGE